MIRKIAIGIIIIVALAMLSPAAEWIMGGLSGAAAAEQAGSDSEAALLGRIEKLERELAARSISLGGSVARTQEEEESGLAGADYSEQLNSMAQSLATIAGKAETADRIADSLAAIVERLAAIEEELAWYRMDRMEEEEPSEEGEPEQQEGT